MTPPRDIKSLAWAAEELGISKSTAYRLAESGQLPGAFRVGRQWRVSVVRFTDQVHGDDGRVAVPRTVASHRNLSAEWDRACRPDQQANKEQT